MQSLQAYLRSCLIGNNLNKCFIYCLMVSLLQVKKQNTQKLVISVSFFFYNVRLSIPFICVRVSKFSFLCSVFQLENAQEKLAESKSTNSLEVPAERVGLHLTFYLTKHNRGTPRLLWRWAGALASES